MKKILVIRLSSLGDVILTTPLVKHIKQNFPESQLDFCTKSEFSHVIRNNNHIDNIIEAENDLTFSKLRLLKAKLRAEKYDIVIDAHNKLNTFYLRIFSGRKTLKLKKYSIRKFLYVNFKINLMKNLPPISERCLNILPVNTESAPETRLEISSDSNSVQKAGELLRKINPQERNIICINPSSKHFTKTYPPELYAVFINKFNNGKYVFVLTGRGNDKINTGIIKSKTGNNVYDLCDKLNVSELFELMKKCSLVISGDTGPMHIADAAGVPLIMLAGSSVREFGFYPQSKNAVILENNKLSCRPCSHIGRNSCPKRHFKCMREITPEEIKNAAESLLLVQ